jgi:hypothetical protein
VFSRMLKWGWCYSICSFMCMSCRSMFGLLFFLFLPLCCLSFFDLRILIAPWYLQTLLETQIRHIWLYVVFFLNCASINWVCPVDAHTDQPLPRTYKVVLSNRNTFYRFLSFLLINPLKLLLWKFKSWLTTCIY